MKNYMMSVVLLFVINAANAQPATTEKSSHYKAAEEMLTSMGLNKMTDSLTSGMLDMQLKSNPMLASKRDVMQAFFKKYMNWQEIKEDYIKIYMSEFTESEIKDITAFYRTPTGKKMAEKAAVLGLKGSEISQKRMRDHLPELQELLMQQ